MSLQIEQQNLHMKIVSVIQHKGGSKKNQYEIETGVIQQIAPLHRIHPPAPPLLGLEVCFHILNLVLLNLMKDCISDEEVTLQEHELQPLQQQLELEPVQQHL